MGNTTRVTFEAKDDAGNAASCDVRVFVRRALGGCREYDVPSNAGPGLLDWADGVEAETPWEYLLVGGVESCASRAAWHGMAWHA